MRLADVDWGEALAALPRWEALSPMARKAFVTIKPSAAVDAGVLGPAVDELVSAGFIIPPGPKGRLFAHAPELRPLLVALRAMDRLRPLDGPGGALTTAYVQDQLNLEEAAALGGRSNGRYTSWVDRDVLADTVSSVDWLNDFLAVEPGAPLLSWEQTHLPFSQKPRLASPAAGKALRQLLRALAGQPHGVPLRDLGRLLPDVAPHLRPAALSGGLRYLLLFVSLRNDDDPQAVVGLLPAIIHRLGPPPPPPAAVPVAAVFEASLRISDMTAVLVDAAAEPLPVRGDDGSLYVRAQRVLAARFVRPPEWAEAFLFGLGHDDPERAFEPVMEMRIDLAVEALSTFGLAKIAAERDRWQLSATKAGRAWLARAEGERLKEVLDGYRTSKQRTPGGWSSSPKVDFLGVRLQFPMDDHKPDVRGALSAAFLSTPSEGMVPLDGFVRHHAELHNPLLGKDAEYLQRHSYYGIPRNRQGWESIWGQVLQAFLRQRLLPLGGARLGRTAAGGIAFSLTKVGRYLLGGTNEFHFAAEADGEVVVQPDFEVVFLSAAPRIESELSRLAERTGTGHVGALFHITRASVLRAAESGLTAEAMLKTLGQVSRAPVPANVARQVRDWFGGTRRVRIRPAVLVECPDTETAARVTALGGPRVSAVTRTLLRLDGDEKSVAALVKKLRAKGIFVQS